VGDPQPIPLDVCKKLWVPWVDVFQRYTFDEMISKLIVAFGVEIASEVFPEEVARITRRTGAPAPVSAPAAVAPTVSPEPPAPVSAGTAPAMQIDLDGPAIDLDAAAAEASESSVAQKSPEELEAMYLKMLEEG
jgi:hypothetical protein